MPRPVETIPETERLCRGVRPEWVEGEKALPDAVDLQGMSVNRDKYNPDPAAAMLSSRGRTGVAYVTVGRLPGPIRTPTGVTLQFRADDAPEEDNSAHAEIRPYRVEGGWDPKYRINPVNRQVLKQELADRMELVLRPTPAPAA